MQETT